MQIPDVQASATQSFTIYYYCLPVVLPKSKTCGYKHSHLRYSTRTLGLAGRAVVYLNQRIFQSRATSTSLVAVSVRFFFDSRSSTSSIFLKFIFIEVATSLIFSKPWVCGSGCSRL
ncbi:unnamed protein product [Amoebophrya sp. A25]|nr:unnamed protein product [Amoebophrya sp. A25]|eukprot:GSA25T00013441001.1